MHLHAGEIVGLPFKIRSPLEILTLYRLLIYSVFLFSLQMVGWIEEEAEEDGLPLPVRKVSGKIQTRASTVSNPWPPGYKTTDLLLSQFFPCHLYET